MSKHNNNISRKPATIVEPVKGTKKEPSRVSFQVLELVDEATGLTVVGCPPLEGTYRTRFVTYTIQLSRIESMTKVTSSDSSEPFNIAY